MIKFIEKLIFRIPCIKEKLSSLAKECEAANNGWINSQTEYLVLQNKYDKLDEEFKKIDKKYQDLKSLLKLYEPYVLL